jgi:acyl dehydratase
MRYFEDVATGDKIETAGYGPLTIVDTVRWAGVQENLERLHWDREFAREHSNLPTFIASGSYRQALLARTLTDWVGPRGRLRKLSLRHTAPTLEGDMIYYSAVVSGKSSIASDSWISCDIEGHNQDNKPILTGRCVLALPLRTRAGR